MQSSCSAAEQYKLQKGRECCATAYSIVKKISYVSFLFIDTYLLQLPS